MRDGRKAPAPRSVGERPLHWDADAQPARPSRLRRETTSGWARSAESVDHDARSRGTPPPVVRRRDRRRAGGMRGGRKAHAAKCTRWPGYRSAGADALGAASFLMALRRSAIPELKFLSQVFPRKAPSTGCVILHSRK